MDSLISLQAFIIGFWLYLPCLIKLKQIFYENLQLLMRPNSTVIEKYGRNT